jgi:hypothetical protein
VVLREGIGGILKISEKFAASMKISERSPLFISRGIRMGVNQMEEEIIP